MSRAGGDSKASLTESVQRALDDYFYGSGTDAYSAPLSVLVAAFLATSLTWHTLPHGPMALWLAGVLVVSASMYAANTLERLRQPVDARGVAWAAIACAAGTGVMFGLIGWVSPLAVSDGETRMLLLAIQLAVSAGSVGGLSGLVGLGRYVVVPMWLLAAAALMRGGAYEWGSGILFFLLVQIRDLTNTGHMLFELVSAREQVRDQAERATVEALHDPLTGLFNRAGLESAVRGLQGEQVGRRTARPTVMYVDLDHFKSINDRFGHAGGDLVLCEVGARLRARLRRSDILARLGGDEFLLVLPEQLAHHEQDRLASELIFALEEPFVIEGAEARISASIGITTVDASALDLSIVQQEADQALYLAKGQGRRRFVRFDDGVRLERDERSELESALRRGIAKHEITAWGQPLTELSSGRIIGFELLARWQREDGSFCPPSVFIPIAEEIGLIGDLGHQMLEQAGMTLDRLRAIDRTLRVTVNLSPRQLVDEDIVTQLDGVLERWQPEPGTLVLELTESSDLHVVPGMTARLGELVARGAALALDDFGSGYSSVGHLLELPLQYVKIEGSLVAGLEGRADHRALVRSVCELAGAMDRRVVVEGVETETQAALLRDLGVDYAQGFLWGRPRPLDEWIAFLQGADTPVGARLQPVGRQEAHEAPRTADH